MQVLNYVYLCFETYLIAIISPSIKFTGDRDWNMSLYGISVLGQVENWDSQWVSKICNCISYVDLVVK